MKFISVFCGSSKGNSPVYAQAAQETGRVFAEKGICLIYGAGNVGLMGILADAALEHGGKVVGVIPEFLKNWEVCHDELTELHVVDTMHERKYKMAQLSEAVIALPGGFGTLDEVFDMLTLGQLRQHQQTVGLLNVNGYFDFLLKQLDTMVEEGFLSLANRNLVIVADDIETLLEKMDAFIFPMGDKWIK